MIRFTVRRISILGFVCAAFFWCADIFVDVIVFGEGEIVQQLLEPTPREITLRGLFVLFFGVFTLLICAITRQRDRLEESLSHKAQALEAANRELESFSHSVSHDLRKPLTVISTAAQALAEKFPKGRDELAGYYIGVISDACGNMDELIDGLQLLAQISRRELRHETVDMSLLAVEISSGLSMLNPDRCVVWDISPSLVVKGDNALMRILLENIIGNAWKYTALKSEASISFGRTDTTGGAAFYLRDNGVGFDMSRACDLFKPFVRLHDSKEFPGAGIGLATVRRIIERHGGSIWVESAVDAGTVIYFILPEVAQ